MVDAAFRPRDSEYPFCEHFEPSDSHSPRPSSADEGRKRRAASGNRPGRFRPSHFYTHSALGHANVTQRLEEKKKKETLRTSAVARKKFALSISLRKSPLQRLRGTGVRSRADAGVMGLGLQKAMVGRRMDVRVS